MSDDLENLPVQDPPPVSNDEAADYQFSPVAQVTLDQNGCILRINVAATILLKGERSQLLDIPFIAFVEKSYCQIFLDHLSSSLRSRKMDAIRLVLASYTRAAGPVELLTSPGVIRSTGESICRVAIIARGNGESPAIGKTSISQSYEQLFELSPDAVIVQVGSKIAGANPAAAKLLGAESSDQLHGRNIYEIIHPDYRQLVRDRISRLEQGETELPAVEEKFVRLDGQNVIVSVISRSTTFYGKAATMILARDLSKDAQLKEDLVQARDLAAQILANNSEATAIISLETGRFLRANQVFCDLAGLHPQELSSRTLSDIGWDLSANEQGEVMGNFGTERSVQNCEARVRRSDGSFVEVLASGKTILFGSERAVLLMVQDLTDLRRLKQDIVKIAEEEQRRFSRDLHDSHCQYLIAIAFFAETIAETLNAKDVGSANQVRALGKMVRKSAENVHTLAAGLGSQQI
jgi:PAS domain S-box-containing protein